jgi:uncharacterized membrane protein YeaQ/YmgE (transglycosylase-associated protein family)
VRVVQEKWFGREPAIWIQGFATIASALVVFGLPWVNDTVVAAITGVLTAGAAAWTALHVHPVAPSIFGSLISAVVGAVTVLHVYDVSQQQAGAIQLAVATLVTILTRPQQTPYPPTTALADIPTQEWPFVAEPPQRPGLHERLIEGDH